MTPAHTLVPGVVGARLLRGNVRRLAVWGALLLCIAARCTAQDAAAAPVERGCVLRGSITDTDGDAIATAKVTLSQAAAPEREATTDAEGSFRFTGLAAGSYTLHVTAEGFREETRTVTLAEGELRELDALVLKVAETNTAVDAITEHDLAQQQVKQEEQQRLFAVLPNFYVAYGDHVMPLDAKQKFDLTFRTVIDPTSFVIAGMIAGVQQADGAYSGYDEGALGYGKRYAAAYGNFLISNVLGGAVFPAVFRQDPRYFYKGTGSRKARAWYAVKMSVIARGDNGKWQPAYAGILGSFAAGAISNTYYPTVNRDGVGLTIENGVLNIVGNAIGNVVQEFFLKRVTTKTPNLPQP